MHKKIFPWLFVGILIGYVLGGIGPSIVFEQEKETYNRLIDELEKDAIRRSKSKSGPYIPLISETLQDESSSSKSTQQKSNKEETSDKKEQVKDEQPIPENVDVPTEEWEEYPDMEEETESIADQERENFRDVVEIQQMRAEQSRMALMEQANLSEEEIQQIDEIFDNLNSNLSEHSDDIWDFMEAARAGEEVDEVELYKFTHNISGILYDSQSELENVIGGQTVDKEAKRILNYIDLEFLVEVMDEENPP